MAGQGWFDPSLVPAGWFDNTAGIAGWFDYSLISSGGAGDASATGACASASLTAASGSA